MQSSRSASRFVCSEAHSFVVWCISLLRSETSVSEFSLAHLIEEWSGDLSSAEIIDANLADAVFCNLVRMHSKNRFAALYHGDIIS